MENLVVVRDNQVVVNSRQIAESFEKLHKDVLETIREILSTAENSALLFTPSKYTASNGKANPEYIMNRDGFTLLAMSFTGSKAMQWKLKYIEAFNEMEKRFQPKFLIPQTYGDALLLASNQALQLERQAPKVKYHDDVLDTQNFMTITEVAKSEGFRSARDVNELLEEAGVVYRVGYKSNAKKSKSSYPWAFTASYTFLITEGFAKVSTGLYESSKGRKTTHSIKWSEKGRKWLHDFLCLI